jgi:hypothetical protein
MVMNDSSDGIAADSSTAALVGVVGGEGRVAVLGAGPHRMTSIAFSAKYAARTGNKIL